MKRRLAQGLVSQQGLQGQLGHQIKSPQYSPSIIISAKKIINPSLFAQ